MLRKYCRITEWSENVRVCLTPYITGKSVYGCSDDTLTVGVYSTVIPDIIFQ